MGVIGVFNLPAKGYLMIQYLAVRNVFSNLAAVHNLIDAALKYSASRQPRLLKAVTLSIQPYVEAYQRFGFKPIRRILRIAWDTTRPSKRPKSMVRVIEISNEGIEEASRVFIEGLQPYWDWWIEEGGEQTLRPKVADWIRQSTYLAAKAGGRIVGVASVFPHPKRGEASFSGTIVLPKFRMKGIGSALLQAALDRARQLGYQRLVAHTMAYLDALAPGAVLYLKSGGRIEAEYLQLLK